MLEIQRNSRNFVVKVTMHTGEV